MIATLMTKARRVEVMTPENLLMQIDRYAEGHYMEGVNM